MCLEKRNSVEMNVYIEVVSFFVFCFALFNKCDAANDCSINSDDGEGFFFAITIRVQFILFCHFIKKRKMYKYTIYKI